MSNRQSSSKKLNDKNTSSKILGLRTMKDKARFCVKCGCTLYGKTKEAKENECFYCQKDYTLQFKLDV